MFPGWTPHPVGLSESGSGLHPLVILLLFICWAVLLACAAVRLVRAWREGFCAGEPTGRLHGLGALALVATAAVAVFLAPHPPVLSTYSGLMHVDSAHRIAALEWEGEFPADYPLATPAFASLVVATVGEGPDAFGLASIVLVLLGVTGTFLLGGRVLRSRFGATIAGLVAGCLPLVVLVASGDSLGVGLLAVSPWCVLFCVEHMTASGGARRTGLTFLGSAASLALACQTRPEALLFPGVLVLAALLVPGPFGVRHGLRRLVPVLGTAGALLLPWLLQSVGESTASGRLWWDLRHHLAGPVATLGVVAGLAVLMVWSRGRAGAAEWLDRHGPWAAAAALAAFCAAGLVVWGPAFLFPRGVCFGAGCTATTFRTVPVWHVNPALVPLPLVGLVFAGLAASPGRREERLGAFLVLWTGWMVAAASCKSTGELPFDGARTQVTATVPFALLAGAGAQRVVASIRARWRQWAALAAAVVPFYPVTVLPVPGLEYTQQQEFRVLSDCAERIPDGSVVYAPDDLIGDVRVGRGSPVTVDLFALYRTDYLVEVLEPPGAEFEVRGASQLWADGGGLARGEAYFLRTLSCYRGASGRMNLSCRRVFENAELDAVCEESVVNRAYDADYYEHLKIQGDQVIIGVYRVLGPRVARQDEAAPSSGVR